MDTITAVRNRILTLCGERSISINKLATICALPPFQHEEYPVREKPKPQIANYQDDLRRSCYHSGRVLFHT